MKKMMITAMIGFAAFCGFGSACTPEEVVVTEPTLVYTVTMTVNTPKGESVYTKGTTGSVCSPDSGTEATTTTVRTTDKTKICGYIYDCTATCDTIASGSIVLWDTKRQVQIEDAELAKTLLHVISKKQTKGEWVTGLTGTANYDASRSATYELTLAGFGDFSTKKGFYTAFNGTFTGTVSAVYDRKAKNEAACDPAGYYLCEDLATLTIEEPAVAYGTFSIKYNASASKKYAKNGYLAIPSYVTIQ